MFKGFLFALFSVFAQSVSLIAAKYVLKVFNPVAFCVGWLACATIYCLAIVIVRGRIHELKLLPDEYAPIIKFSLAATFTLLFGWWGAQLLEASMISMIARFQPIIAAVVAAICLGEHLQKREFIPISVMIIGGVIMTIGSISVILTGMLLLIAGMTFAAIQWIFVKKLSHRKGPMVQTFYRNMIAAMLLFGWGAVSGQNNFVADWSHWAALAFGALLGPCISVMLLFESFNHWEIARSSAVTSIQPLIVIPMAYLVFHTVPDMQTFMGGMILLCGAVWLTLIHRQISKQKGAEVVSKAVSLAKTRP
jgi:drug/metabolite transporter (DMT)-like permease